MIPMVITKDGHGETGVFDIYSRLLNDRIIFLGEEITDCVATAIIAQFLHLSKASSKKSIDFYIMSDGGDVHPGFAIYDTMQYISCDVATYCIGQASSMAAVLLAAGAKGKRYALPSSRIMLHQPWAGIPPSDASALKIFSEEMEKNKQLLYKRLAKHTGKGVKQLATDCDRDFYMSPDEAVKYGLIDAVLEDDNERDE